MATYGLTYDIVTPESAAHGDFEECGWARRRVRISRRTASGRKRPRKFGLAAAIREARKHQCTRDNGDGSFYSDGSVDIDYRTGAETSYAVHFEGLTPSTLARVARAIGARS